MTEEDQQPHKTIASVLKDLEPIRDLAKNWDIDIALWCVKSNLTHVWFISPCSLEEYLHELGHAGDLGVTSMDEGDEVVKPNFAQAALLLHNSSHVYSRKVEYLYSLVFQALDSLSAVNSSQKRASKGRASDPELEDFREFDPHQEFLLLDDVLPTDKSEDCRHINLAPSAADQERMRRYSAMSSATSTPHANISMRTQNLSGSTMGKSFHTLGVSQALNQINTQSSAVLRLMNGQCDLDPSGRLLLPGCQSQNSTHPPPRSVQGPPGEQEYAPTGDYDGDGNGDYDEEGPGFMMADDENTGGDEMNNEQAPQTAKKKVTFAPAAPLPEIGVEPERPDPWAMLDPHTADTRKLRPLKLGKTLKLPLGIDDLPSDCVTGSNTRKWKTAIPQPSISTEGKFFATEAFQALSRKRRLEDDNEDEEDTVAEDLPMVPMKGLVYGEEFAYLAREHVQRKAADRRQLRRTQRLERAKELSEQSEEQNYNNYDDDDFGGGYDFGGDDENDYPVNTGDGSPMIETNTGLQAMEDVYRNRSEDDTDSVVDARAFEALCRAHIAKFAKGAEKYASETQLTQRVDQWQEKLEPLLVEEEERPEFDIHKYGHEILVSVEEALGGEKSDEEGGLQEKSRVVDFDSVTKDCPSYQVCRYFLATLCLCNTGNVLLEQDGKSTNKLSVKLLSTDHSRPMETYQAPSVVEENM
eukprot:scaffold18052_cov175-Amphora_coffeaeformis.AAC.8